MNDAVSSPAEQFYEQGYLHVPSALDAATVASFQAEVGAELLRDYGVDLGAVRTWPRGGARRVFETLPVGDGSRGSHWRALWAPSGPLAQALDAVVGCDQWELNLNVAAADGARSTGGAAGVEVSCLRHPWCEPFERRDESNAATHLALLTRPVVDAGSDGALSVPRVVRCDTGTAQWPSLKRCQVTMTTPTTTVLA
jgi:hypothetical protein